MFTKEWIADYQGNKIVVRNSWGPSFSLKLLTGEAKLYINGNKVDTCSDMFTSPGKAAMRGGLILEDGKRKEVEIYMKSGLLSVFAKICIDGERISGDSF